ncbi:unnamed protein product [Mytilus edulis]|uniref:Uncharacterized protein n=1 Tax=Mytilus edulis TaxID=6550 RepID=A0A8S3V6U7_MYTED|nr:unnamed protein product [Mytilus edulis]
MLRVKLLERCSSNEDCPSQSSCKERGCDGRVCICENTYMPSESDTPTCVKRFPESTLSPHTTTSTPTSQNTSTQTTTRTQHYVTTTPGTVSSYITGSISTIPPITKETLTTTSSPAKYYVESSSSIQQSSGSLKHSSMQTTPGLLEHSSIQPTSSLLKQSTHTNSDNFSSTPVIKSFTKSISTKELITSSYSKSSEVALFTSKSLQISQTVDIDETSSYHHTYKLTEKPLMSKHMKTKHPSIQVSILNTGTSLNLLSSSMISKQSRQTIDLDLKTTSYKLEPSHSLSVSSSVEEKNSNTPSLNSVVATRSKTTCYQSTTDGPHILPASTFSVSMTSSMQTVTSARETTIQNLPTGKTTETTQHLLTAENKETTPQNLPTVDITDTTTTLYLTKGHREPRACSGGAEDDISDPIYHTAIKSKY